MFLIVKFDTRKKFYIIWSTWFLKALILVLIF